MNERVIEITAAVSKPRRRRPTPAADIVAGLRADGLLPFSPRLSLEEAFALARFLRDLHAAWGTSGALTPPRLDGIPTGNGRRAGQPGIPTGAAIRIEAVMARMRGHERFLVEWMERSRGRTNITLVRAGHEWSPNTTTNDNKAASIALGMIKSLCRTLIEIYPIR